MLVNDLGVRERIVASLTVMAAVLAALVPTVLGAAGFEIYRYLRRYKLLGGVKFWMITQVLNMVVNAFSWGSIVAAVGTGAAGLIIIFGRAALLRLVRNHGIRGAANI